MYGRVAICSWFLLLNFWRFNYMRIRLAIAFISMVRDVQNVPIIHMVACYCILLSTLRRCNENRSSLNTLCIIHLSESSSWNTPWLMFFEILKSLYLFYSSFFKGLFKWIFLASSHTLSPVFSSCRFYLFLLNCLFIASFAISIDFVASSQLLCSPIMNSSSFGNSVYTVKFSFHECLPKLSSNKMCPVAIYFLSLYWNSTATNHSVQSFYW